MESMQSKAKAAYVDGVAREHVADNGADGSRARKEKAKSLAEVHSEHLPPHLAAPRQRAWMRVAAASNAFFVGFDAFFLFGFDAFFLFGFKAFSFFFSSFARARTPDLHVRIDSIDCRFPSNTQSFQTTSAEHTHTSSTS
jgi:hypothetical protein